METTRQPSFEEVDDALRRLGTSEGAPEAHGSLCGMTCFLGARAAVPWMAGLLLPENRAGVAPDADTQVLGVLAGATCEALSGGEMAFTPLLPPDDCPLAQRANGLAEWCTGFMHGLGEAAGAGAPALESDLTREIMADFGEIARVALSDEESDLEAEAAYAELVEFVRVSVQLVFEQLGSLRDVPGDGSVH